MKRYTRILITIVILSNYRATNMKTLHQVFRQIFSFSLKKLGASLLIWMMVSSSFFSAGPISSVYAAGNAVYYVASNGSDINDGLSPATAWKTIDKVNAMTFDPGDTILFRKWDTFYGWLVVEQSGTAANRITFSSYGSGENPVITGFTPVSSWTNLGGNIWESTSQVSTATALNLVVINNIKTGMGRYPNIGSNSDNGFLRYQTSDTNKSITSSSLNSTITNRAWAEAVIRPQDWITIRTKIDSHVGSTLNYTEMFNNGYGAKPNYGFFIQNDVRTLDAQNEWYYDTTTKKLKIWSTSMPTDVKVPTVTNLFYTFYKEYITIDGIDFNGSAGDALYFWPVSSNLIITNCKVTYSGLKGIASYGDNNLIDGCTVDNTIEDGVYYQGNNAIVRNNIIMNVGLVLGLANYTTQNGIGDVSNSSIVTNNQIKNIAGNGIWIGASGGQKVQHNIIDNVSLLSNDSAGIYWFGQYDAGQTIDSNVIMNVIGNADGISGVPSSEGIYIDDSSQYNTITNNIIFNSSNNGIKLHINNEPIVWGNIITGNTSFNNGKSAFIAENWGGYASQDITVEDNIFFAKTTNQYSAKFISADGNIAGNMVNGDNNYYAKPINPSTAFYVWQTSNAVQIMSLSEWQVYSSHDGNSHESPVTVSNQNEIRFEYATWTSRTIPLWSSGYIDVKGVYYSNSLSLQPWTSVILMESASSWENILPIVYADQDKSIYLPENSLEIVGSGSDIDGLITSYLWTLISGSGSIVSPNNATTTITELIQGTSVFRLTVTDNDGATASDEISITVSPTPTNPVVLFRDCYYQGYAFGLNIADYTTTELNAIGIPDNHVSSIKVQSGYRATLYPSDNFSGTWLIITWDTSCLEDFNFNDMLSSIKVESIAGIPPTAYAGSGRSINLPTNSLTIVGSWSDTDGTIVSYLRIKVSGSWGTIVSPNDVTTLITWLSEGSYIYRLTVTDNNWSTSFDEVTITVNAAATIIPPKSSWSSGWGWGWWYNINNLPTTTPTSQDTPPTTKPIIPPIIKDKFTGSVASSVIRYTQEEIRAYEFARSQWYISSASIEQEKIYLPLTRGELAIFMGSHYSGDNSNNIINTKECEFNDISPSNLTWLKKSVDLLCNQMIMGKNMGNQFQPNAAITRAESATVLSRFFARADDGEDNYYTPHIKELHDRWYITETNPNLVESKSTLFIILLRVFSGIVK